MPEWAVRMFSMRNLIGALYLVTGLLSLYWSIQKVLTGMYGVPFSWWYAVVGFGSLVLILGAILWWASARSGFSWVPLIGAAVLVAYFIPAIIVTAMQYARGQTASPTELAVRAVMVLLVLISFAVAVSNKLNLRAR